jgi:hypothetical protein
MAMVRKLLIVFALLSATACSANTVVLSPTSFYAAYTPTILNYAATRGGILVDVTGNPFDAPQEDLEQAITQSMTGSHFGPRVGFLTTPPEDFVVPYRVVMVFDAAQNHTDLKLCRFDHGIDPQAGEKVRVHAALCAKESPLTAVSGQVAEASGPGDPRFHQLIRQITVNLLPPFNPDRRDSGRGVRMRF